MHLAATGPLQPHQCHRMGSCHVQVPASVTTLMFQRDGCVLQASQPVLLRYCEAGDSMILWTFVRPGNLSLMYGCAALRKAQVVATAWNVSSVTSTMLK